MRSASLGSVLKVPAVRLAPLRYALCAATSAMLCNGGKGGGGGICNALTNGGGGIGSNGGGGDICSNGGGGGGIGPRKPVALKIPGGKPFPLPVSLPLPLPWTFGLVVSWPVPLPFSSPMRPNHNGKFGPLLLPLPFCVSQNSVKCSITAQPHQEGHANIQRTTASGMTAISDNKWSTTSSGKRGGIIM